MFDRYDAIDFIICTIATLAYAAGGLMVLWLFFG